MLTATAATNIQVVTATIGTKLVRPQLRAKRMMA
jgi:hypothetical protein